MKQDNVSVYVHVRRVIPLPSVRSCTHFGWPSSSPHQLRTYLTDGLFLNQKTYKDIRISHSLKYKHLRKINFLQKNKW